MFAPTSTETVFESAETIARVAMRLLNTRSLILRGLLRCAWIWQVPGLGRWVVYLAWRASYPCQRSCPYPYSEIVDLACILLSDGELLSPVARRYREAQVVCEACERNGWLRSAMVSYYADRLREGCETAFAVPASR